MNLDKDELKQHVSYFPKFTRSQINADQTIKINNNFQLSSKHVALTRTLPLHFARKLSVRVHDYFIDSIPESPVEGKKKKKFFGDVDHDTNMKVAVQEAQKIVNVAQRPGGHGKMWDCKYEKNQFYL